VNICLAWQEKASAPLSLTAALAAQERRDNGGMVQACYPFFSTRRRGLWKMEEGRPHRSLPHRLYLPLLRSWGRDSARMVRDIRHAVPAGRRAVEKKRMTEGSLVTYVSRFCDNAGGRRQNAHDVRGDMGISHALGRQ